MDEEVPAPVVPVAVVVPPVPKTVDQMSDAAVPYVRAGLTVLLVGSLVGFYAVYKWAPDVIISMGSGAFGFYFGARLAAASSGSSK